MTQRARTAGLGLEPLEPRTHLSATLLSQSDVSTILAQAASQARPGQVVAVSDRDGAILGIFAVGNVSTPNIGKAVARAQTAAYFESSQEAFTTRTARFIIQDHFPYPVPNTPGGPLYGVEFSSLPGTDTYATTGISGNGISGDPGGIPLFIDGQPVGGVGVAGDGHDLAPRADLKSSPNQQVFNGTEEYDFDEAVAQAGATNYMAPASIRADKIFLDGLRLPFVEGKPAAGNPTEILSQLITDGVGSLKKGSFISSSTPAVRGSPGSPFATVTISAGGKLVAGENKNPNPAATNFGVVSSTDPGVHLTYKDVNKIISSAIAQAEITRGAIRLPIGQPAGVHVAVVDLQGNVLGVFKTADATNFSYDVAIQKARTAAFFSDDNHAFSTRAIGFISQAFFPPGIRGGPSGPLYHLQNDLSTPLKGIAPLQDGITIFPGGEPLYKDGKLVGAIGVSGDGVDQDDLISFAGTAEFRPDNSIRSDALPEPDIISFLKSKVTLLETDGFISSARENVYLTRLDAGLQGVQLPYVKFPRNPNV